MVPGGSRRRPFLAPLGVALVLVLLGVGIWLGGHPSKLPAFVRNAFVSDKQGRLYQEAVSEIQRDYYHDPERNTGHCPADSVLGLENGYTPGLARLMCREGAEAR